MRKVALAITGLLLALGSGAQGRTVPAKGPSPWCEGHADMPTGDAVTASAGVERGRSATGVFVCYEVGGSGSRPTSSNVVRAWADPDEAQAAVECVPHRDARVAKSCYKRADTPADDHRKSSGADDALPGPPAEPPAAEPPASEPCDTPCVEAEEAGEIVERIEAVPEAITTEVEENVPRR